MIHSVMTRCVLLAALLLALPAMAQDNEKKGMLTKPLWLGDEISEDYYNEMLQNIDETFVLKSTFHGAYAVDTTLTCKYKLHFSGGRVRLKHKRDTVFYHYGTDRTPMISRTYEGEVSPGETIKVSFKWLSYAGEYGTMYILDVEGFIRDYKKDRSGPRGYRLRGNENTRVEKRTTDNKPLPKASLTYTVPMDAQDGDSISVHMKNRGHLYSSGGASVVEAPQPAECTFYFHLKVKGNNSEGADGTDIDDEDEDDDDDEFWEEDNWAFNQSGFMDYAIPIAVVLSIIGGAAAVQQKKKKKKKNPNGNDNGNTVSHYEMRVYKDFGDTISSGSGPQPVYARIVKTPAGGGEEVADAALTAQIQISGDQYLKVSGQHLEDGWMCTDVEAPDMEPIPEEGVVTFTLAANKGSYTNRLHFHIEAGKVLFGQNNITLAAHYDKEVRLPFVVLGMAKDATIEAAIVDGAHKPTDFYSIHVEWNEEKEVHEAVIIDQKRDPVKDNGTPGNYIPLYLRVNVYNPGGSKIEGWISLVRYYMGLVFRIGDVKCYAEELNPQKQKLEIASMQRRDNGQVYVPAETTGRLLLYTYNEEEHRVVIINPVPTPESWSIKAVTETEQQMVDKLGVHCTVVSNKDKEGTECILRCLLAVLDAPTRLSALITLGCEYNGEKYDCETQVMLASQPRRHFETDAEWEAARKEDDAWMEKLGRLHDAIEEQGLGRPLMPLLTYIHNIMIGHEYDYGFDRNQMHAIGKLYNHMINDRFEYTYGERIPAPTLADDILTFSQVMLEKYGKPISDFTHKVYLTFKPAFDTANTVNEYTAVPIMLARIVAGVVTMGKSEAAFRLYDAASIALAAVNINEIYVNQGLDGLTANLTYMVKESTKMQICMTGISIGLHIGFGALQQSSLGSVPVKAGDIKPKTTPKPGRQQFSGAKRGRMAMQGLNESRRLEQMADAYVKSPEAEVKLLGVETGIKAEYNTYAHDWAVQGMKDWMAVVDLCDMYVKDGKPIPGSVIALRRKISISGQKNPMLKKMMRNYKPKDPKMNHYRQMFNEELYGTKEAGGKDGIYAKVQEEVKMELAIEARKQGFTDVLPDKIEVETVSGNKLEKLWDGETVAMDLDEHYYYKNAKGEKVAFDQAFTEQCHNRHLYEIATGYESHFQHIADDFALEMDSNVIQDIAHHHDSLSLDAPNLMEGGAKLKLRLKDPEKVAQTITFKTNDRVIRARKYVEMAETITDYDAKMQMGAKACYELQEAGYMSAKDASRFVFAMDEARYDVNGQHFVSDKLRRAISHCKLVDTDNPISAAELEKRIKSEGYSSMAELGDDLGNTFRQIVSQDIKAAKQGN